MKITVYTITTCQFSKQEREYLASHGLQFEEKNLEMNREFLSEMLTVGNNFAGTPVTKIEKDDGQIVVLKGFTKEEFDKALGFETKSEQAPAEVSTSAPSVETQPATADTAVAAPAEAQTAAPTEVAVQPPTPAPEVSQTPADPAMASILTNLEQKATTPAAPAPAQPAIPDPKF